MCALYVKLESSGCRSISDLRPGSIDRILGKIFFLQISNSTLTHLKRLGLYIFAQVYKENPSHVLVVAHIAICVNLLWDL